MNSRKQEIQFRDELDDVVSQALQHLVNESPLPEEVDGVLSRLHRQPEESVTLPSDRRRRRWSPLPSAVAASLVLGILWMGAQTQVWGQVAANFQRQHTGEVGQQTLNPGLNESSAPFAFQDPALRFVLMLHVFGLTAGLLGLFIVWGRSSWNWFRTVLLTPDQKFPISRWGQKMHLAALIVYAGGILFGCVWSIVAWGQLWQWDPREAFALFTLGIAVIWYASTTNHETNSVKETFRHTTTATISFWMIVLMFILGGIYAARLHSYGFPSPIPTVISILFLCNLVLLATSYWWRLRQISSTPP